MRRQSVVRRQSMQRQSSRARLVDSTSAAQSTELSARRQTDQPSHKVVQSAE